MAKKKIVKKDVSSTKKRIIWKACWKPGKRRERGGLLLVKLEVPPEAAIRCEVVNNLRPYVGLVGELDWSTVIPDEKLRVEVAKVVLIEDAETGKILSSPQVAISDYANWFCYQIDHIIRPAKDWTASGEQCAQGIHGFKSKAAARRYFWHLCC